MSFLYIFVIFFFFFFCHPWQLWPFCILRCAYMQTKWLHYHLPILLFRCYKNGKITLPRIAACLSSKQLCFRIRLFFFKNDNWRVRSYAYGLDTHMVHNIHIPWGVGCRYKQIVKDFYINAKTYCVFCIMVQASIILWLLKTFQISTCVHWKILFLTRLFAYWSHPVNYVLH